MTFGQRSTAVRGIFPCSSARMRPWQRWLETPLNATYKSSVRLRKLFLRKLLSKNQMCRGHKSVVSETFWFINTSVSMWMQSARSLGFIFHSWLML